MSEIKVDSLTGKTSAGNITVTSEGGAATMQLQQGLAKAWLSHLDLGAFTLNGDSLNAASFTDIAAGYVRTNWSSPLSSASYENSVSDNNFGNCNNDVTNHTTSYAFIATRNSSHTLADSKVGCVIHGDLA